jgi:hypothetical protein
MVGYTAVSEVLALFIDICGPQSHLSMGLVPENGLTPSDAK